MADGKDVGQTLIDRGMAVAYDGGTKSKDWCQMPSPSDSTFTCSPRKKCSEMASCEEAYFHLRECDDQRLDRNKDGVPCESLCK